MLLAGKSVLVTGGSRGVGRAIAIEAARHGADVAINFWRDNDSGYGRVGAADEVVAAIKALGRRALAVEGNIAKPQTSIELIEQTVAAFGKIDVLASNAGICPFHAFLDLPAEMFQQTM